MTAWKPPDGSLLAPSVIVMDEAGMARLDALPGWKRGELGYQFPLPGGGQALVLADVLANSDPPPGLGGSRRRPRRPAATGRHS
jgi:hypothetical protein